MGSRGEIRESLEDITRSTVYICLSISRLSQRGWMDGWMDGTSILRKATTRRANTTALIGRIPSLLRS